jgi:predicted aspartyl protease
MAVRVLGRITLLGSKGCVEEEALFDTGASKSFVDISAADKLGYVRYEAPKEVLLAVKNYRALIVGEVTAGVIVEGVKLPIGHVFGVIESLRHPVVIGMDIMEPYEIYIDVKEGKPKFKRIPPAIELI